ncbi:MAG: hypothetical protein SGPRY_006633 [Prymnesium sp.]
MSNGDPPVSSQERAHIKGQLQGLRAALRQQPAPLHPPTAVSDASRPPKPSHASPQDGTRTLSSGRQAPARRPISPRLGRPPTAPTRPLAPPRAPSPTSSAVRGRLTGTAAKVEQMKREREERRRKAAEVKALRAEEAKDAEGKGGIESVEFLRKIHDYRAEHHIGEAMAYTGGDLWGGGGETRILVCVRKRPMLRAELGRHDFDVVSVDPNHSAMILHEPKTRVDLVKSLHAGRYEHAERFLRLARCSSMIRCVVWHRFNFDAVYNEADNNHGIYSSTLQPLLAHVFNGGLATVFAFGQTGSGKTCTMAGHDNQTALDGNAMGLYGHAAEDIMVAAAVKELCVCVSFFEVYRGQVLDLLNQHAKLEVLEDAKGRVQPYCVHLICFVCLAQVVGLQEERIRSPEHLMGLVHLAAELRATGSTSANETSSRSHAILQAPPVLLRDPKTERQCGKLYLVDLAGSERAADSASKDRQTRLEGAEINKSLLCLKVMLTWLALPR